MGLKTWMNDYDTPEWMNQLNEHKEARLASYVCTNCYTIYQTFNRSLELLFTRSFPSDRYPVPHPLPLEKSHCTLQNSYRTSPCFFLTKCPFLRGLIEEVPLLCFHWLWSYVDVWKSVPTMPFASFLLNRWHKSLIFGTQSSLLSSFVREDVQISGPCHKDYPILLTPPPFCTFCF